MTYPGAAGNSLSRQRFEKFLPRATENALVESEQIKVMRILRRKRITPLRRDSGEVRKLFVEISPVRVAKIRLLA